MFDVGRERRSRIVIQQSLHDFDCDITINHCMTLSFWNKGAYPCPDRVISVLSPLPDEMQQKVYSADDCWSLYHNSCLFLCWSCCSVSKINSFLQVRATLLQQTFKYLRDMLFTDTTQDWLSPAWKSCPVHGNRYYFSVRRDGRRAFEINPC